MIMIDKKELTNGTILMIGEDLGLYEGGMPSPDCYYKIVEYIVQSLKVK